MKSFHTCTREWTKDLESAGSGVDVPRRIIPPEGCEKCQAEFESMKSYCAFCWREVSNRDYLKNDYHQSGKCRTRTVIKIPEPRWKSPAQPINGLAALLAPMPANTKYKPIKHKFFLAPKKERKAA